MAARISFVLSFLTVFAAASAVKRMPANVPWFTDTGAEHFLQVVEKVLFESGELQLQGINDLHSVSKIILSLMKHTSAKISIGKIQALNMALASIIASIISSEGRGSLFQKINIVRKALIQAFRETSSSVNIAFVREVVTMIKLFVLELKENEIDGPLPQQEYPKFIPPGSATVEQTQVTASSGNDSEEVTSIAIETSASSSSVSTTDSTDSERTLTTSAEESEASSLFAQYLTSSLLKNAALDPLFDSDMAYASALAEVISDAIGFRGDIFDLISGISQAAESISPAEKSDPSILASALASAITVVLSKYGMITTQNAVTLAIQIENSLSSADVHPEISRSSASTSVTDQTTTSRASDSGSASSSSAITAATPQSAKSVANAPDRIASSEYTRGDWKYPPGIEFDFSNAALGESTAAASSSAATATTTQSAGSATNPSELTTPSEYVGGDWKYPPGNEFYFSNPAIGESIATSSSSATTAATAQTAVSAGYAANPPYPINFYEYIGADWKYAPGNKFYFSNAAIGESTAASSTSDTTASTTQTAVSSGSAASSVESSASFRNPSESSPTTARLRSALGTNPTHIGLSAPSEISGAGYGLSDDAAEGIFSSGFGVERPVNSLDFPTRISAVPSSRRTELAPYSSLISEILGSPSGLTSPASNQRIASLTASFVAALSGNYFNASIVSGSLSSLVSQISQGATLSRSQAVIEAMLEVISVLLSILSRAQLGVVSTESLSGVVSTVTQSVVNALNA